ncbi:MAG TPA: ABC transporter permease [Syntrophomonadaceae bacterium]|nr:ABC transporter permease [Syntrophomonadaceae bacterium]HNX29190.1 ABC transporter permease [Syntrophomonadaceae bacterium]HPR92558.1 ABC transporter permease [Syntrophomonadaceae bacterium]
MRKLNNSVKYAPYVVFILLLLLWEISVTAKDTPSWLLPAPSQIILAIAEFRSFLFIHTLATVCEALAGYFLAVALAFIIALVLNNCRWLKSGFYPLLMVTQTIPLIILAILLPVWFGFGFMPKIIIVVIVCFFPIVINFINGLESVDVDQLNLFRSMGAKPRETFFMVKLPAAIPAFFSGLRISATYSIMAAVISEWVGAKQGLGYFMTIAQKSFRIDQVLAAVTVICILSLLLVKIIDWSEYLLIPWNRRSHTYDENISD